VKYIFSGFFDKSKDQESNISLKWKSFVTLLTYLMSLLTE